MNKEQIFYTEGALKAKNSGGIYVVVKDKAYTQEEFIEYIGYRSGGGGGNGECCAGGGMPAILNTVGGGSGGSSIAGGVSGYLDGAGAETASHGGGK